MRLALDQTISSSSTGKVVFGADLTLALCGAVYVLGYFLASVATGPRSGEGAELARRRVGLVLTLAYVAAWGLMQATGDSRAIVRPKRPPALDVVNWVGAAAALATASAWLTSTGILPTGLVRRVRGENENEQRFADRT